MSASTIRLAIVNALVAGDNLFTACEDLQYAFAGQTPDQVKATLITEVVMYRRDVSKWDVSTKVQGSGRVVLTGDKTAVNSTTRQINRLLACIIAKTDDAKEEIEVPADILAAAAKLWALCQQYESAGKLAAKALAQVKAG
jgi:hypothetical protein